MSESGGREPIDLGAQILEQLRNQGVDLRSVVCGEGEGMPVRVAVVAASVGETLDEMGQSKRDQVLMVRVDQETAEQLDAWVETEAVKSRSEAAALFIREGLQVRSTELAKLREAIEEVDGARQRLRERVQEVLGTDAAGE